MSRSLVPLRMQLNTFYSGPQAWLFLAEQRGYLRDEGLAVEFVEGDTAANTVPRMAAGGFDIGYGDLNALISHVAHGGANAPLAIFSAYNASPYTIAFPATTPLPSPGELPGKLLAAHPADAALLLFPEFCRQTGIDAAAVRTEICAAPHSEMLPQLMAGRWDGMFGFVNTLIAAAIDARLDPRRDLRFIEYNDHIPDLYGMAIMAAPQLVRERPEVLGPLLRAFNRGLQDTVRDIDAAIDALAARSPAMNRASNRQRLLGTLQLEMGGAEGATLGIGELDAARLERGIALMAATRGWPVAPRAEALFSNAWLPPPHERMRSLAREPL